MNNFSMSLNNLDIIGLRSANIPIKWREKLLSFLQRLLVLHIVRPDRFLAGCFEAVKVAARDRKNNLVEKVLTSVDLRFAHSLSTPTSPLIIFNEAGSDTVTWLKTLAEEESCNIIIPKDKEFKHLEATISLSIDSGEWVIIPIFEQQEAEFLGALYYYFREMDPKRVSDKFRVWVIIELDDCSVIPASLLSISVLATIGAADCISNSIRQNAPIAEVRHLH